MAPRLIFLVLIYFHSLILINSRGLFPSLRERPHFLSGSDIFVRGGHSSEEKQTENVVNMNVFVHDIKRGVSIPKIQMKLEELLRSASKSNNPEKSKTVLCFFSLQDHQDYTVKKEMGEVLTKVWDDMGKPIELVHTLFEDHFDIKVKLVNRTLDHNVLSVGDSSASSSESSEIIGVNVDSDLINCDVNRCYEYGEALNEVLSSWFTSKSSSVEKLLRSVSLESESIEFGHIIDNTTEECLKQFDDLIRTKKLQDIAAMKTSMKTELVVKILNHVEPMFRDKLEALIEVSWNRMQQGLVSLRAGDPDVMKKMETCINDANTFFKQTSKEMIPTNDLCDWSPESERRKLVKRMQTFVGNTVNIARAQGSFVQGVARAPISFSLHYLQNPIQMYRFIRNGFKQVASNGDDLFFSYHEDICYNPSASDSASRTVSKLPLPFGSIISKTASKLAAPNERK